MQTRKYARTPALDPVPEEIGRASLGVNLLSTPMFYTTLIILNVGFLAAMGAMFGPAVVQVLGVH